MDAKTRPLMTDIIFPSHWGWAKIQAWTARHAVSRFMGTYSGKHFCLVAVSY